MAIDNHSRSVRRAQHKYGFARELRSDATECERKLWALLRGKKFAGLRFRRQHPLGPYLSFKKQIVVDVCSRYWGHRKNFSSAVKTGRAIAIPNENFALDFRIFEAPFSSIELLQRELQERVRSSGPSLAFFALLREAMDTLEKVLAVRSDLIARFREAPLSEQYAVYFSAHPNDLIIDGTYPFQMKMVEDLTNDCIGTSIILGELLEKHGRELAKKFGNGAPKIVHVVAWSESDPGLVPDMARYRDWLEKAFIGLH